MTRKEAPGAKSEERRPSEPIPPDCSAPLALVTSLMGYSQDQPAIPPLSTNPVSIPISPIPHDSPLQSPRTLSSTHDGPSSLPSPSFLNGTERTSLPTRASTLGTANELDHIKSQSDPSLAKHSRSEDLNHSSTFVSPSPAFHSSSRPNTPGSGSYQASSEHLGKSARQLSGASGSSQPTSDNRPAPSIFTSSSSTLVS